jgi:protein-disulfide isomerase
MKRYLPFLIIFIVLLAGLGVAATLWKRSTPAMNSNNLFTMNAPPNGSSPGAAPNAEDPRALTKPAPKPGVFVVLEEYGDYQCPPCGQLYPELKQIEKEYGSQVQIVFHHFPLMKIHKNALAAAHAAEAARNQNKFWEMHDLLYRNQKEWSELADPRPVFQNYAKQLSLNLDSFDRDLESNIIDQKISSDIQRGTSEGVTGTPTVFLDSHLLKYESTNLEGLRRGINILLDRKSG